MKKNIQILIIALFVSSNIILISAQSIIAQSNCKAEFSYQQNYAVDFLPNVIGKAFNFYDKSTGDSLKYYWDFGDGSTSNDKDCMHAYIKSNGGNIKVQPISGSVVKVWHTVYNSKCKEYTIKTIQLWSDTIAPAFCTASIDYKEISDSGLFKKFQFFGTSPKKVIKWYWDFGNGNISLNQNPIQTFKGTYVGLTKPLYSQKVTLTILSADSCTTSASTNVDLTISGQNPDSVKCNVSFNYSVDSIFDKNKAEVRFTAVAGPYTAMYLATNNDIIKWQWDFGDGIKSTEALPVHVYNKSLVNCICDPDYNVSLNAINRLGCVATYTQKISPFKTISNCSVYFISYRDSFPNRAGLVSIHFNSTIEKNSEMMIPGRALVKWHWDFGDSTFSEEANPVHTFKIPNIECFMAPCVIPFNVCLTATNAEGCVANYCSLVYPTGNPQPQCQAKFNYTISKSLPPIYGFSNISKWTGGKSYWTFGDGDYSNDPNPNHVFKKKPGTEIDTIVNFNNKLNYIIDTDNYQSFNVCLTIYDTTGCTSHYCESIYANSGNPGSLCNNLIKLTPSIILGDKKCSGTAWAELIDTDGKIVKAKSYYWSTGETTPSASNICTNTTYSLSITDYNGCTTANSFTISDSNTLPNYGDWKYENKDSIYIFSYLGIDSGYKVQWNFSDGISSNGSYAPHKFVTENNNWVELVVSDSNGKIVKQEIIKVNNNSTNIQKLTNQLVKIYPIPASDILNIELSKASSIVIVEIIDLTGRLKASVNIRSGELFGKISISQLPKGMYICRVRTINEVLQTTKFIIQ